MLGSKSKGYDLILQISLIVYLMLFPALLGFSTVSAENLSHFSDRKLVIGYSGAPASVDYWKKLSQSLLSRAQELGVIVVNFTSDEFTYEAQQVGLHRAVEAKIDGMIIGAVDDEISESIDLFRVNNIPVVAVNTEISSDWVAATVATDNNKAAEIAGIFLLDRLGRLSTDARRVVILCGDYAQEAARIRASVPFRMLTDAGYEVHIYYSKGWSAKHSLSDAIAEFSSNGKKIAAVFSCYADATVASVEAAEAYGLRIVQVGFDMDENMRMMIKSGQLDGTVVQDPAQIGAIGIEGMVRLLKDEASLPEFIDVPARLVTRDNVKNF